MTIPYAGGTIAFLGEDVHGWDFKVQKALKHATSLGLTPMPLDPDAPAELVLPGKRWGSLSPTTSGGGDIPSRAIWIRYSQMANPDRVVARSSSNPQLVLRPEDLVLLLRLALDSGPAPTYADLVMV